MNAADTDLVAYCLRLGDDALVLAHRLGGLLTRAPMLEEDVALANISLDLLGQARALLGYAGTVEGAGRDEDDLAFLREPDAFAHGPLGEVPDADFAVTMVRQLAFSAWQAGLYGALLSSTDPTLAAVAGKAVKEVAYHLDHASHWVIRLGDGTEESARRATAALAVVWPTSAGLFVDDDLDRRVAAAGLGPLPSELREAWDKTTGAVLDEAQLATPRDAVPTQRGVRTDETRALLQEMQSLHREHPDATW